VKAGLGWITRRRPTRPSGPRSRRPANRSLSGGQNDPRAHRGIIKQLAAEQGITAELLTVILRVSRQDRQAMLRKARIKQIIKLEAAGVSQREIGRKLRLSDRSIRTYLADAKLMRGDL